MKQIILIAALMATGSWAKIFGELKPEVQYAAPGSRTIAQQGHSQTQPFGHPNPANQAETFRNFQPHPLNHQNQRQVSPMNYHFETQAGVTRPGFFRFNHNPVNQEVGNRIAGPQRLVPVKIGRTSLDQEPAGAQFAYKRQGSFRSEDSDSRKRGRPVGSRRTFIDLVDDSPTEGIRPRLNLVHMFDNRQQLNLFPAPESIHQPPMDYAPGGQSKETLQFFPAPASAVVDRRPLNLFPGLANEQPMSFFPEVGHDQPLDVAPVVQQNQPFKLFGASIDRSKSEPEPKKPFKLLGVAINTEKEDSRPIEPVKDKEGPSEPAKASTPPKDEENENHPKSEESLSIKTRGSATREYGASTSAKSKKAVKTGKPESSKAKAKAKEKGYEGTESESDESPAVSLDTQNTDDYYGGSTSEEPTPPPTSRSRSGSASSSKPKELR